MDTAATIPALTNDERIGRTMAWTAMTTSARSGETVELTVDSADGNTSAYDVLSGQATSNDNRGNDHQIIRMSGTTSKGREWSVSLH